MLPVASKYFGPFLLMLHANNPNRDGAAAQASFAPAFAPMPLRERGVLEILDVAVKVFRQYLWVLLGWSALVNLVNSIPLLNYVSIFITPPLLTGAAAAVIAAAVRGQTLAFRGCWSFTKPRYWNLVAMHVLSLIVLGLAMLVLIVAGTLLGVGLGSVLSSEDLTTSLVMWVIVGVLFTIVLSIVSAMGVAWVSLIGVVVCMEEDKQSTTAMGRAWQLLRGQWKAAIGLMLLLGTAALALQAAVGATAWMMNGLPNLPDMLSNSSTDASFYRTLITFALGSWLVFTIYWPVHYLAATLLYLDLRVRKEALDLEWTAHLTAPPAPIAADFATPNGAGFGPQAPMPEIGFASPRDSAAPPTSLPNGVSVGKDDAPNAFSESASSPTSVPQSTLSAPSAAPLEASSADVAAPPSVEEAPNTAVKTDAPRPTERW